MDSGRNLASIGFDLLHREMLASALSIHGWRVLNFERERPNCEPTPEIVLVCASRHPEAVIDNLRRARAELAGAKVVLLGVGGGEADVVRFIAEGACAYVPGSKGITDLITTLEMVRNNRTPSSGTVTQMVLESISRLSREHPEAMDAALTDRENEVLHLIIEGLSNKEIADRLTISPSTVKNHVHHLLEKLKVGSRHEAAWVSRGRRRPLQVPSNLSGT